jgi:glycosyltransferase involved in cell wall biosynthesis
MLNLKYALVTPARNEVRLIEQTIQSVLAQTIPPAVWVIVSDGSTDGTDDVIASYLKDYPWLQLVRMPQRTDRHFAAKVHAFNAGLARANLWDYDIIGNLDADITFEPDYFSFLLQQFAEDNHLGVAGTPFIEAGVWYDYRFTNIEHVSGACQLFRRACFEEIGGYTPLKRGGVDWQAVTTARMKGWKTRTFTEKFCYHRRGMGTAEKGKFHALFRQGVKDYYLGGHPLWQVFRALYQTTRKPYFLGGSFLLLGYVWSSVTRADRQISPELIRFHRREQMERLRKALGLRRAKSSEVVAKAGLSC